MPPILPPGSVLNVRYRISRVIHQPGLSCVYHAQDQHVGQKSWAIREIYIYAPNQMTFVRTISYFQAEIFQTKKFEHPNLATVVDYFTRGSALYIVRNYVEGNDLAMAMYMRQLTESDILYIGMQLCDLLIYLCSFKTSQPQERAFIASLYKHLRLSNLVLSGSGKVTMLDLCCGELRRNSEYCAPEQFTGTSSDEQKILIYNLGALLYHLLTGINPEDNRFNLVPPDNYRLDLSSATVNLINKATSTSVASRQGNLHDLLNQLTKAYNSACKKNGQSPKPLPSKSAAGKGSKSSMLGCIIIGIAVLLLSCGVLFFLYSAQII